MRKNLIAAAGLALLAAGCMQPLTDPATFQIISTGPTSIQGSFQTIDGSLRYACPVSITLVASGGNPGDVAVFTGVDWNFRQANGGSNTEIDDDSIVSDMFGTTRLTSGGSISSVQYRVHSAAAQTTTTMNFHYEYAGSTRSVAFTFICR